MKKYILFLIPFCLAFLQAEATHIRAGEIIAERISSQTLKFRFTVIGYTDTEGQSPPILYGTQGVLNFGDGRVDTLQPEMFTTTLIEKGIALNVYQVEHTFQAPGEYTISYMENNRNEGVMNIPNSVEIAFYVETKLVIDPFVGLNNSPVLLIPPIDKGVTGMKYMHNPGAYDIDGDSLAYKLVLNKRAVDTPVDQFLYPNDPMLYEGLDYQNANQSQDGPPTYSIDPLTGTLEWDAPGLCGEYNVAFVVEEWRKILGQWTKLGYVTRDMQIIIECSENTPPELIIPNDTCIVAGELLEVQVKGVDEEDHDVMIEAFGGPFEMSASGAVYMPDPPVYQPTENDTARLFFSWQTECKQVRDRPYTINFKASDDPKGTAPSLTTFETWNVSVVGPPPVGLTAQVIASNEIELNWNDYECTQAETMQVWRRVDTYDMGDVNCMTGVPPEAGYVLVGEVPVGQTTFTDNDINSGANYCYRLVAQFPQPAGGESIASEEACGVVETAAPVITHVDVLKTDETQGEVQVRWQHPLRIDSALFPPPYTYEVFRINVEDNGAQVTSLGQTQDTTLTDSQLNTKLNVNAYQIVIFDANMNAVDTSAMASQVKLSLYPQLGGIGLQWSAEVPWTMLSVEYPWHYIYRNRVDPGDMEKMVLIDSVFTLTDGFKYMDTGETGEELSEENLYCYKVATYGSYGNPEVLSPLINRSQIACAQPNDTVPPCAPLQLTAENLRAGSCEEYLESRKCDIENLIYVLKWEGQTEDGCENDILAYKILFSASGDEEDYDTLATVTQPYYEYKNKESFAGCFKVVAVDRSGNMSEPTEEVCIENCTYYELPNIFTPNGDGINETFRAFSCPLFVKSVEITIYNRWGRPVYDFSSGGENSIYIEWDGKANNGQKVASGIYYYKAEVEFQTLYPYNNIQLIKGWVDVRY